MFPVEGARDALRNLEAGVSAVDGTRSFALTREPSDHPPPTASRTSEKVMPAWVHCEAAPRNAFLRDSTRAKMPASVRGIIESGAQSKGTSDGEIPCLLVAAAATRDPNIGRTTRRNWWGQAGPGLEGSLRQRVPGKQEAGFFQDSSQVGSVISGHIDDVPKHFGTRDPVPTTPAGQGVVSPFTKRAVCLCRETNAKTATKADPE